MKMMKVSKHIWRLKVRLGILIHVWLVVEEDGVTLVDAGIPMMARGILNAIKQLDAGPLKNIVLTHGHSDHVGAIKRILHHNPVPIYAHRIEIPFIEGELPYPRRKKAAQTIAKGVTQPLEEDDNAVLLPIESLTPFLAPGHSPGHVVYYHEKDRVLLAGDLFTSKKGKLRKPMAMFTADMATAIQSSRIVHELKPEQLEVCHGDAVSEPAAQWDEYMRAHRMV